MVFDEEVSKPLVPALLMDLLLPCPKRLLFFDALSPARERLKYSLGSVKVSDDGRRSSGESEEAVPVNRKEIDFSKSIYKI